MGQFAQPQLSPKCHKGFEVKLGQAHIKLDGAKLDGVKSDSMSITVWIRLLKNDRGNTIYGCLGAKGVHHLTVESIGAPNAVVHWLHKSPDAKVVFDVRTEPAVPAGQ